MKLTEPDTQAADSIYVARLPQAAPARHQPRAPARPPALAFVTEEPRATHINLRLALMLIVVVIMAVGLWVLITSPTGSPGASHRASLRLTPAEQRAAASARARAAAIAQVRRDRGTDAQWQDPSPAATR